MTDKSFSFFQLLNIKICDKFGTCTPSGNNIISLEQSLRLEIQLQQTHTNLKKHHYPEARHFNVDTSGSSKFMSHIICISSAVVNGSLW